MDKLADEECRYIFINYYKYENDIKEYLERCLKNYQSWYKKLYGYNHNVADYNTFDICYVYDNDIVLCWYSGVDLSIPLSEFFDEISFKLGEEKRQRDKDFKEQSEKLVQERVEFEQYLRLKEKYGTADSI